MEIFIRQMGVKIDSVMKSYGYGGKSATVSDLIRIKRGEGCGMKRQ